MLRTKHQEAADGQEEVCPKVLDAKDGDGGQRKKGGA
jgi:hypothetical protein